MTNVSTGFAWIGVDDAVACGKSAQDDLINLATTGAVKAWNVEEIVGISP